MIIALLGLVLVVSSPVIENQGIYLLISALFMIFYFLMPIMAFPSAVLILQSGLLIGLQWLVSSDGQFILIGLFLLLFFEAANKLKLKGYIVISSFMMIFIVVGQLLVSNQLASSLLVVIIACFLAILLWNRKLEHERLEELQSMYENLLIEYRAVKRESFSEAEQARVQERTRIARDIHDSVGHQLTALLMQLEMGRLSAQSQPEIVEMLGVAKEIASHSLQETRKAVKALRAEEPNGIASVIHLIKNLETNNHLKVSFTTKNGVLNMTLSNEVNIVLYRTIQEALTNVMRHGKGKQVDITLDLIADRSLRLTMANESKSSRKIHEGFGLSALRERIEQIGRQMSIYQKESTFNLIGVFPLEGIGIRGKDHGR